MMATMQTTPAPGGASRTPALLYAVLALLGGAAILTVYPPLQVPEEGSHFARAFQVSEGGWRPQIYRGVNGGVLPTSLLTLMLANESSAWHQESRISNPSEFYREQFQVKLEPERRAFTTFARTTAEPPLPFLPQAAGIRLARLASDSALATIYGARIGNLLVGIVCVVIAMYLTPVYKWVFVCLALSPLVLGEMASATGFGLTYGVAFLFVALVLRLAFGGPQPATGWQIGALLVLTAALCLVMQGYIPLVLLYFLIPAAKMGGAKRYWLVFAAVVLIAVGSVTAWQLARAPGSAPLIAAGTDPAAQVRFIRDHPGEFATALRGSIGKLPLVQILGKTYSGVLLTDSGAPGPLLVLLVPVCALVLLFVCFVDATPSVGRVGLRQRLVPLVVALLGILTAYVIMYVYWMPVGATNIHMWPRQLVPAGLVLLLVLFNLTPRLGGLAAFVRAHMGLFVVVYFVLRYSETVLSLIQRYYRWHS